ncbi:hypothetical protein D3C81_178970 [compost metagenome]
MANPMIDITDDVSVRASQVEAVEVRGATVIVYVERGSPMLLEAKDIQQARAIRNNLLNAVRQAEQSNPI